MIITPTVTNQGVTFVARMSHLGRRLVAEGISWVQAMESMFELIVETEEKQMQVETYPIEQTKRGTFVAEAEFNGQTILAHGATEKEATINRDIEVLDRMRQLRNASRNASLATAGYQEGAA